MPDQRKYTIEIHREGMPGQVVTVCEDDLPLYISEFAQMLYMECAITGNEFIITVRMEQNQ